jgi:hypothetical protein
LNIRGVKKNSSFEVRNRLFEPLQLHIVESKEQVWNKQLRLKTNRLAESVDGLWVLAKLVVHQPEIRLEFGNFRMDIDCLPVEFGGRFKITPGLGLLRRGQERFKLVGLLSERYA